MKRMLSIHTSLVLVMVLLALAACESAQDAPVVPRPNEPRGFSLALSEAALERTRHRIRYDPKYVSIPYPGGDVPPDTGVCTDVVIRAYRSLGVDLQKDVHLEMSRHFKAFPRIWGLKRPDTNIDHRRVPNLRTFFRRKGENLKITDNADDYLPGDLVTWSVDGRPHIGIVVNKKSSAADRYMIVHNIGRGTELEDMLFQYEITGHYRYYGGYTPKNTESI